MTNQQIIEQDPMIGKNEYSEFSKKIFYEKIKRKKLYTILNQRYLDLCLKVLENSRLEIEKICDVYYNHKLQNKIIFGTL